VNHIDAQAEFLKPSSYHLFKYQGENLLFDLGTTILCEVDDLTFKALELSKLYPWEKVISLLLEEFPEADLSALEKGLQQLNDLGLFTGLQSSSDQRKTLTVLWNHKPRRLQLFMAQQCNLRCKYCYGENNESNQQQKLMTFEVAKQAVDYLIKRSGNRPNLQITFFGGEPTLNFGTVKKVVEYCRNIESDGEKKFLFELITNGTLLNREMSDYLLDNEFLLFVSIDGNHEMNNFQRPSVNGIDYYSAILDNAQYLVKETQRRKLKHPVKIRANLTSEYPNVTPVAEYLDSLNFNLIGIGSINPLTFALDSTPMALTREQQDQLFDEMEGILLDALEKKKSGQRVGAYASRLFNKTVRSSIKPRKTLGVTCGIGRNTNAVDCSGNIYPCHRYVGSTEYIIGNIFDGLNKNKTMGLYNSYNQNAQDQCNNCWARDFCAGGCPWELSCPDGNIYKRSDDDCQRRLRGIERSLWLRKEARKHLPHYFDDNDELESIFNFWKTEDGSE